MLVATSTIRFYGACKHHSSYILELELELELIQTHMTQKPMLRVEVGALGARQAKN